MRGMLILVITLGLIAPLDVATATPVSSIEQHWELMNTTLTRSGSAGENFNEFYRGLLPGGTTQFDPQPTVSFHVSGSLVGASGITEYRVKLINGYPIPPSVIAEVVFGPVRLVAHAQDREFPLAEFGSLPVLGTNFL